MSIFTSSLPDELLSRLSDYSKKLGLPKNKLLENALNIYLDHLKRSEYISSYRNSKEDKDILSMAEEGMESYLNQLEDETR
ncbi:ribbon-helix-helix domain-containing protein [Algoriphagus mannitolivorans]|uniref:ribbon-helix-helix domain-containing protein n=1 Tax=Algoriphagus mannitolivorans TaxID=226504 RepID=UPI0004065CCA|nr:ribbon-helix-helix domain-containing protein [Algoriphagus mannitolivorans]